MFGYESEFYYKALSFMEGYGLRKQHLRPIMDKFPDFNAQISGYMVNFYYKIIRRPMLMFKKEIKIEVGRRQDMEMIIAEVDNEISRAEE
eukprot:CAMPEP_0116884648 /NCGR_PEP_ID=MMETSP0463-20121206/17620_1 /TAXON_ID=181622 /ORGANISM="Strombidinopsis sp, Strain SopsisLIS2011" /LENGTH=89 /DNA_ID=CAMNT_0004541523 /DNA_START=1581 /DNA_END=1850 /DNA_ORIENTATION=+